MYHKHQDGYIPVSNGLSDKISKDLKKRGFKFLGTVTVYSHLQACGIICDHGSDCHCYKEIVENYPTVTRRRYLEKRQVVSETIDHNCSIIIGKSFHQRSKKIPEQCRILLETL